MPRAREERADARRTTSPPAAPTRGWWSNFDKYIVSLLKAWFGDAATAENDYGFGAPAEDHRQPLALPDDAARGRRRARRHVRHGPEPGGRLPERRAACGARWRSMKWLVVRDFAEIETATFWRDAPEVRSGELRTEDIETEVFLMPAATHVEKEGSLHQHPAAGAVARQGARPARRRAHRSCGSCTTSTKRVKAHYADSTRRAGLADRQPRLGLPRARPAARAARRGRPARDQRLRRRRRAPRPGFAELQGRRQRPPAAAGSTAASTPTASTRRGGATPATSTPEGGWVSPEWALGLAGQPPRSSTTAPPPTRTGKPWSERKKYVWWDEEQGRWTGYDVPDFPVDKRPDYRAPEDGGEGMDAISRRRPVHHDGRRPGLALLADRPARRPAAHALRADRVAGAQPALPRASAPTRRRSAGTRPDNPLNDGRRPALPARRHDVPAHRAPHRRRR